MTLELWKKWKADFIKRWKGKRPHCKDCGATLFPSYYLQRVEIEDSGLSFDTRADFSKEPDYWGYDKFQNFCSLRCGITWANRQLGKQQTYKLDPNHRGPE